jgi:gustatory receptor
MVFKERLNLILQPGKRFDEYVYGIIFLSILIPHFLLPVAAWTNGTEVAKFKNMWTRFQVNPIQYHIIFSAYRDCKSVTYFN